MSLRVGFLTTLGFNVGDEFIREGVRAVLDGLGVRYRPLYVNKLDEASLREPRDDEVDLVGDKYWDADLFVQSGAPVYWRRPDGAHRSVTAAWHRWMWVERILDRRRADHPVFVNLGAGSGQPWGDDGRAFLDDAECVGFARAAAERSALTTVRDPLASEILARLGIAHESLPCPALLAAARHPEPEPEPDLIGVNLMPLGGHNRLDPLFDDHRWWLSCTQLVARLRGFGRLVFVAHDERERAFAGALAGRDERVYAGGGWRGYLGVYGACAAVVANRVHGAVAAAGYGTPAIILGNDSRARIGDFIGLAVERAATLDPARVAGQVRGLLDRRGAESARLLALRGRTVAAYRDRLRPIVERLEPAARPRPEAPAIPLARLASVAELSAPSFTAFMASANAYAHRHGLRTFTNWSKVWEYPWLWFNALRDVDWKGATLVDLGSELSPMPWLIGALGARVVLVETDERYVRAWERVRRATGAQVSWRITSDERIPVEDGAADVVTSFSVVEHQPDKRAAADQIARVLRPGGLLAMSFDLCEPEMGMAFPAWNGRALTMREFEATFWSHPAFGGAGGVAPPRWNVEDIPEYLAWHRESAPHHTYVTGAAVLRREG